MNASRARLLTGDRPTGRLHLGHFVGTLRNRIEMQDAYESFFIIADLHTLTTRPERSAIDEIGENVTKVSKWSAADQRWESRSFIGFWDGEFDIAASDVVKVVCKDDKAFRWVPKRK